MDSLVKACGHAKDKLTVFKGYIQRMMDGSSDTTDLEYIKKFKIAERLKRMRETKNTMLYKLTKLISMKQIQ